MKKTFALTTVLGLFAASILLTGCASNPKPPAGDGTTVTNKPPIISQQTLNDSAVLLRNAARNAAALAIQDNPDNRKYVALAVTTMDTFLVGADYTPGALVKAMEPVLKEVKDVRIALAVNTVTDFYEVFYGRYVKSQIAAAANGNALLFLTNLRQGAAEALDITAQPAAPPK